MRQGRTPLLPIDHGLGRPFPEQDELREGESGSGYGLRMACRNGLSFGDLAGIVESPGHRYLSAKCVKYLAYLFGASPAALARATPAMARLGGRDVVIFHDAVFTRPYLLRHGWPRLCPVCVLEEGFARSYWELSIVTACWKHRARLLDECQYCSRKISWRRPGMLDCFCGASYMDQVLRVEDATQLELAACFEEKLCGPQQGMPEVRPLFRNLSLNSLLRLVWCLGIVSLMPDGVPVPGKVTRAPNVSDAELLVRSAMSVLDLSSAPHAVPSPMWLGGELAEDLTTQEVDAISSVLPNLAERDRSIGRMAGAQLRLSLDGEG